MALKIPSLVPGTEVAIVNCVTRGVVVARKAKNLYTVLWKGQEIECLRSMLAINQNGRWVRS